jgi:hypothetical protein
VEDPGSLAGTKEHAIALLILEICKSIDDLAEGGSVLRFLCPALLDQVDHPNWSPSGDFSGPTMVSNIQGNRKYVLPFEGLSA